MKSLLSIGLAVALVLATGAPARADAVYHTERLALTADEGAAGSGMVVNIHPNGPKVYAIEQYQLRHAEPNTTYLVWLHLYLGAENCGSDPFDSVNTAALSLNTAEITTNRAGNGTAQLVLRPEDVAGLRGLSFPINWTVTQGGTTTHATACTIVTLD